MKKIFTSVLLTCLFAAVADAELVNGVAYTLNDDGTAAVSSYQEANGGNVSGTVTIPETITCDGEEYTVTSVEEYAYDSQLGLTSVSLPSTIESVGDYAFYQCKYIETFYVYATTPPAVNYTGVVGVGELAYDGDGGYLYVPYGCKAAYSGTQWLNIGGRIVEMEQSGSGEDGNETESNYSLVFAPADGESLSYVSSISAACGYGSAV